MVRMGGLLAILVISLLFFNDTHINRFCPIFRTEQFSWKPISYTLVSLFLNFFTSRNKFDNNCNKLINIVICKNNIIAFF